MTTTTAQAARGDIAILPRVRISYSQFGREEMLAVELGIITSVSRDGVVKAVAVPFLFGDDNPPAHKIDPSTNLTYAAKTLVDVDAVMAAYRAHVYPGTNQIRPYKSMDEVRALLRQHRVNP